MTNNKHTRKFVSYYRVSTDKQGRSGLGLDAQRDAVAKYLNGGNWTLIAEFTEIEAGNRNDRPALAKAIAACKAHKAKLVIAKLDRLSRDVAFIAGLMKQTDFVCCDRPHARAFELHIFAALSEEERRMISERTKAALAAAKSRGVQLGNADQAARNAADARDRAEALRPIVAGLAGQPLRSIAAELNARRIPAARGGHWSVVSVSRLMTRLGRERLHDRVLDMRHTLGRLGVLT